MSDIYEVKATSEKMIMVGLTISDTISSALRSLIDSWKSNGEKSMEHFKKELQGKRFKDEGMFILHAKRENTGLTETAVSKSELKEFQKLCKEYGIDFHFQKRPANIEELFERKQKGEKLSDHQESVVNAFTIYDDNNVPHLKSDGALITFKEKDLPTMERVLDKMEERTYGIEQRKLKAKQLASKKKNKEKSKVKKQKIDIEK